MEITTISLGVIVILAAILGGGIESSSIRIPRIASLWQRILVGLLGCFLVSVGIENPSAQVPPGPTPTPERPPPVPVTRLSGTVGLTHHAAAFQGRHTNYSIIASDGRGHEFRGALDTQGQFRVEDVPEVEGLSVSWAVTQPTELVIWPLVHPEFSLGTELRGFHFRQLWDECASEKGRMHEAVSTGNFGEADQRLSSVLSLFERVSFRSAPTHALTGAILRWRYTVHRDIARAAHDFRDGIGRSAVSDEQILIERKWRRSMVNRALEQNGAAQQVRDFARAANSWALYSRQVFSGAQRHWPDRDLLSRQTSNGGDFLEYDSYAKLLREDIELIQRKLAADLIRVVVEEKVGRQGQMARLSEGQRMAIESFSSVLEQDPDQVSLNQFVNLLSALKDLVDPTGRS